VELVGAVTLLATYFILKAVGPFMAGRILAFSRNLWEEAPSRDWSEEGIRILFVNLVVLVGTVITPILLGGALAGTAANLLQVGFLFTWEPLTPKFERINPLAGAKRLFSRRTLMEFLKTVVKMSIIGYVAYRTVADDLDTFPILLGLELPQVAQFLSGTVARLLLWVGVAMMVMALADFLYQRWEHEESLRMSKQDVKEETKQTEGNPEIRGKIKQKQRELARRRMMQDLRKADVVVTNPTHFAVALGYEQGTAGAPKVLAKGQGLVALRIRELAASYGVAVLENPPLARQLHRVTEVGDEVPYDLYQAVAEVLAFVFQLKQKGY
jgi:flagellar biosynthetic protein FlhB